MQYAFPPRPILDSSSVWLHVLMFALLVVSLIGLYFRRGRRGHPLELIVWGVVFVPTFLLNQLTSTPWGEPAGPAILICVLLIRAVAGIAIVRTIVSLESLGLTAAGRHGVETVLILALLISMCFVAMMPDMGYPIHAAQRVQCRNNMKSLGLAFHNWYDTTGRLPDADGSTGENPPLSWRVALLPYFDLTDLHARYDQTLTWDAEGNLAVARSDPRNGLTCPAVPERYARDDRQRWFAGYVLPIGPQTAFPQGRGITFPEVTDGASYTLLSTEAVGLNIPWTQPRDFDVSTQPLGVNLNGRRPGHSPGLVSSYHLQGGHAVMLDGSARFVSEEIDPQVLRALTTASGGEEIGAWDEW